MNISELDSICKTVSRKVFEEAKHSLINHPFVDTKVNVGMIEDCINFSIKQELGRSILKEFIKRNDFSSAEQMTYVSQVINGYETTVINTFRVFAHKNWSIRIF